MKDVLSKFQLPIVNRAPQRRATTDSPIIETSTSNVPFAEETIVT